MSCQAIDASGGPPGLPDTCWPSTSRNQNAIAATLTTIRAA